MFMLTAESWTVGSGLNNKSHLKSDWEHLYDALESATPFGKRAAFKAPRSKGALDRK